MVLSTVCALCLGVGPTSPAGASGSAVAPPSSIPDDCSVDVTGALTTWFATLGSGDAVNLPWNACYSVSNVPGDTLKLSGLHDVRINGDNATFVQSSYGNGQCGTNDLQPVLWLTANSDLRITDLTVSGPGTCGGASNEGDYGILMGQGALGNSRVFMNGVSIENTDGDGLAILPLLGTGTGINTDVSFVNGDLSNIGYHALTLEGVNGLRFSGNLVSGFASFADLEVDNSCGASLNSGCYDSGGNPTSTAQWNVTISGNSFIDATSNANWIESEQGSCIPQKNLSIESNWLDGSVDGTIVLNGSGGSCATDGNVTIADNLSMAPSHSPCGGSIAAPPACALIEITHYSGVTIAGNTLAAFDGNPGYFANTPYTPCIALGDVRGASVTWNTCNNTLPWVSSVGLQFPPADATNTGLMACGNTYGLTEPVADLGMAAPPPPDPVSDGPC